MNRPGFTKPRKPMERRLTPMERGGFSRPDRRTHGEEPRPRRQRARLRSVSKTRDPKAEAFYRAEKKSITDRVEAHRCENPFCPRSGRRAADTIDTQHCKKRGHFGRKTRHLRDHRDNLLRLCRSCHDWTDEARAGHRGRLVTTALGGERYKIDLLERDHEQTVVYERIAA